MPIFSVFLIETNTLVNTSLFHFRQSELLENAQQCVREIVHLFIFGITLPKINRF